MPWEYRLWGEIMLDNYEEFKKKVYDITKIDLNAYKERQMKRRIDALIAKHNITSYNVYVDTLKKNHLLHCVINLNKILLDEIFLKIKINTKLHIE